MAKLSTYIVFLLLFVICLPTSFFAQVNLDILAAPRKIDSLEKEFQKEINASKPNHGKLANLYVSIIKYYQSIDKLYNADQYLDKWEASIKRRTEPAEELLKYICGRSIQYALMGNEKAALLCLEKAIQLLEKNPIISTEGETEYLSTAIQVYNLLNMPAQSSARIKEYFKLIDYEPYTTNFENLKQPDRFLEFLDKDYDHAIDQNMLDKAQLNRQAAIAYLDLSQVAFESKDQLTAKVYSDALMLTDQLIEIRR